jgi:alkyl hydroperoxide reductase subunit AhpC
VEDTPIVSTLDESLRMQVSLQTVRSHGAVVPQHPHPVDQRGQLADDGIETVQD